MVQFVLPRSIRMLITIIFSFVFTQMKTIESKPCHISTNHDANAIDEALEFYPNFRWKYFQRKRARGTSKGWEDHLPSGDPVTEVITILATFDPYKLT